MYIMYIISSIYSIYSHFVERVCNKTSNMTQVTEREMNVHRRTIMVHVEKKKHAWCC